MYSAVEWITAENKMRCWVLNKKKQQQEQEQRERCARATPAENQ